ncbi:hypothetical protein DPEC_G00064520 [Dallia pectoralis]|uniref:Uncharacterized protein n=1 Tax=Dallia pectoralis TaxID=75939 RepID=A0ACC2H8H5_DALPE|nr:hypothetical protein DPEC_G00064520 [Dallia pectoralis]
MSALEVLKLQWQMNSSISKKATVAALTRRTNNTGSPSLMRYCLLSVLQKELDEYKHLWNTHYSSRSPIPMCPTGEYCIMFI